MRHVQFGMWNSEVGMRSEFQIPNSDFQIAYFEYSSTISCSWTGRLICSRVGIELTRPVMEFGSNDSHSGMPRPFTSSIACSIVGFFWLLPRTVITSPAFTEYD